MNSLAVLGIALVIILILVILGIVLWRGGCSSGKKCGGSGRRRQVCVAPCVPCVPPITLPPLKDGQVWIGRSAAPTMPVASVFSQGPNLGVTIVPGPGSVTLDTAQAIGPASTPTFAGVLFNNNFSSGPLNCYNSGTFSLTWTFQGLGQPTAQAAIALVRTGNGVIGTIFYWTAVVIGTSAAILATLPIAAAPFFSGITDAVHGQTAVLQIINNSGTAAGVINILPSGAITVYASPSMTTTYQGVSGISSTSFAYQIV